MSEQRVIVDRLHEAYNARRFDRYAELVDEDVMLVINGRSLRGAAAVRDYVAASVRELPGVRVQLERVLADSGETIVTETRYLDASPARGSEHTLWGAWRLPVILCEVYRIAGGRIAECRSYLGAELVDELPARDMTPSPGIAQLMAEQTALRRVATLVARGADQAEVFDAIVTETAELLGNDAWLLRFGAGNSATIVARQDEKDVGGLTGFTMSGDEAVMRRLRSERPVRIDSFAGRAGSDADLARRLGIAASAAAPLVVQGATWGALLVNSRVGLAAGIEDRLVQFAELAATAVANAQAQAELQRMADEQGALRRVAELVARGADQAEVFDRVTAEASRLLDDAPNALERYERSGTEVVIAAECRLLELEPADERYVRGARFPVKGDTGRARVWRTGRVTRIDDYVGVAGAETVRSGTRASVSVPVVVEGRLWGVLTAGSPGPPLPAGTEERLARFCELVGAAIANADSRAELIASRARIVASGDEARRRLAQDVHDGAQQRQVHTIITLKQAQAALKDTDTRAAGLVDESLRQAQAANEQLRELAHGIMPAALHRGGLRAGVDSLRAHVPVALVAEVLADRLPEPVETTAYFVVAEALTNVVKHARADQARVRAFVAENRLEIEVSDDGRGGAVPASGSGLAGLADRVDAAGGTMSLASPPGAGTTLSIALPINRSQSAQRS